MQITEFLGVFGLLLALLIAPGLPVGFLLVRKGVLPDSMFAVGLAPLLSILFNYLLLFFLNVLGVRPPLELVGGIAIALGVLAFVKVGVEDLKVRFAELVRLSARVAPAAVTAFIGWRIAFGGFLFVAPNDDALRHNLWIRRIQDVQSVLGSDVLGDTPLLRLGETSGRYPLAWHSFISTWGKVLHAPTPVLSLGSVFVLWAVFLPVGLIVVSRRWAPQLAGLGPLAGVLSQLIPLVPGEPLSWGAMTTPVGISLLPVTAALVCFAVIDGSTGSRLLALGVVAGMVAVHTPEAASLVVVFATASLIVFARRGARQLLPVLVLGVLAAGAGIFAYRKAFAGGISGLQSLWGATSPGFGWAMGSFATLTVNSAGTGLAVGILLVSGLLLAPYVGVRFEALAVLGSFFAVFYVSGAPDGLFNRFRILTSPWYASYERTLWVIVPFAAVFMAVPIVALASWRSAHLSVRLTGFALASCLVIWGSASQIRDVVSQIREEPQMWSVVGIRDRELFRMISNNLEPDSLVVTFAGEGAGYGYMFEGIPATFGLSIDRFGEPNDYLSLLYLNINDLCPVLPELTSQQAPDIRFVLFGRRNNPWGAVGRSEAEVRELRGLRVVGTGDFVTATQFDKASCDT